MQGFVGKPEGKKSLGTPSRERENIITMDLVRTGSEGVSLIYPAQDRDVGCSCHHANEPSEPHQMREMS
jgi:hypothetical protein